jgi:hypothetical protein
VRSASTASSAGTPQQLDKERKKAFSATLLLPKTEMPLRMKNAPKAEERLRARTTDELYRKQVRKLAHYAYESDMLTRTVR